MNCFHHARFGKKYRLTISKNFRIQTKSYSEFFDSPHYKRLTPGMVGQRWVTDNDNVTLMHHSVWEVTHHKSGNIWWYPCNTVLGATVDPKWLTWSKQKRLTSNAKWLIPKCLRWLTTLVQWCTCNINVQISNVH